MKAVLIITICISFFGIEPELSKVRETYPMAAGNEELTMQLHDELESVTKNGKPVLVAYKGAVLTMMSKYTKGKENKKRLFKEGVELIEFAVHTKPNNIEIRTLRLSIQENTPKFLKYQSSITQDREFIINNYKGTTSKSIKAFVKSYVMQSEGFNNYEKLLF